MCNCNSLRSNPILFNAPNNLIETQANSPAFVKSVTGKCFAGLSPDLTASANQTCFAALINPRSSCVNCFLNEFTVCNLSSTPCVANLCLNSIPNNACVNLATNVSPTDTSIRPRICPRCKLISADKLNTSNLNNKNILQLVIPPFSSITKEVEGVFICPSCGSFLVQVQSLDGLSPITCNVSFIWWEERFIITNCCSF
ncbi:hypothetical protein SAMN02745163_02693 [Clostridium cavendishii DSM 21758]|uniref:Uncharacterized protein n=1 Tax=Clostridium cavendishii DSM 21758 TaxID=1121302 RepID=A0A1M6MME3_9CLOT|nr:DUF6143 family protein [Clostridium cavendishii]SHJ84651.1 hypothetical protein SAMN02745163_02693 [Clostridium cavendishii DSM 21758]